MRLSRPLLMLLPALVVSGALFGGALLLGLAAAFGISPLTGDFQPGLGAVRRLVAEPGLVASLSATVLLAIGATILSTGLGLGIGVALHRSAGWARGLLGTGLSAIVATPHLVAGLAALLLLSQSGYLSRIAAAVGLTGRPADFPALVYDPSGSAILMASVWKEAPFMALVVAASLASLGEGPVAAARTLGAGPLAAFRLVTLPAILPAVLSASAFILAYNLGAYEIPALLGASHPRLAPLLAADLFRSGDLADRPAAVLLSLLLATVAAVLTGAMLRLARRLS